MRVTYTILQSAKMRHLARLAYVMKLCRTASMFCCEKFGIGSIQAKKDTQMKFVCR